MKKILSIIALLFLQLQIQLLAQPNPSDRGPGDPGGGPGGPPLGAPVDDFVWGLILFSLAYGFYRWNKTKDIQNDRI